VHLDAFTIMIGSVALVLVCGCFFLFFWTQDRRSGWLAWWIAPYVCGGVALALYVPRGQLPDVWSVGASNAILLAGFGFLWQGARAFERRRPLLWPIPAMAVGWLALCAIPGFMTVADRPLRVIVASLGTLVFLALTYRELAIGKSEKLVSRRSAMTSTFAFGVLFAVRVPLAYLAPYPFGGLPEQPLALAAFNLLVVILVAFFSILMISMTKERREAEQRNYAMSDPLTGLFNRRAFADFAERTARRRVGVRSVMSLLVLDLDHFKSINDRFGHEVGDRMLKAFTDAAEASVRPSDQLFRMGGEEFCFVLPDTSAAEAVTVAERLRQSFEAVVIETPTGPAATTVSIGIASTQYATELDVLLAAADAAVYEAKARGRNRVVVAEPASLLRAAPETVSRLRA
jgi:diguanylate cyclase (GGDEF)-like protein